ncbi:Maf family nucleotide pyrophosphatase [Candidatus Vallotia lariciata]|uniref:Maf family nucleotide pyrophosphatase n=1 Tax=Candidatus Vallotia laricis TaxID=2018052 RepID=UPI001D0269F1|nr:Maf family nucleotide pyrophosphatase [Candidatus Vallotia lariciata]UDG83192.1 Maf-like protein YceF [Candidatus Vallotia lariciata]
MHSIITPSSTRQLILASSSPYRRALLNRLRITFDVEAPSIDETAFPHEKPSDTALRLAESKARTVAVSRRNALVIGSDQVATLAGRKINKPEDHISALEQLRMMRGRNVHFHTAVCLYDPHNDIQRCVDVITRVRFRNLSDIELDAYLKIERPYNVAGSTKSEGLGIALLEEVDSSDPTALVGLPLIALTNMLREAGVALFNTTDPSTKGLDI